MAPQWHLFWGNREPVGKKISSIIRPGIGPEKGRGEGCDKSSLATGAEQGNIPSATPPTNTIGMNP